MAYATRYFFNFNPRSREGSDEHTAGDTAGIFDFNPRSREGSDDVPDEWRIVKPDISIHAPAKGATIDPNTGKKVDKFQSTLPRRERQPITIKYTGVTYISIHAPAKGAT